MATLENVKLLEAKVSRAVELVKQLVRTNAALTEENKQLKKKIDSLQNQINELEFAILGYKEDQQHIETGVLSALDRLNQVEDSLEVKTDLERVAASIPLNAQPEQPVQNLPANGEMFHEQGYQDSNAYSS
ncbi:MAG: cell division protein ZapB [Treponema sp.]|jgi:FtsZ-binding cell division protein ZapB|nr:cell division protein ZapB [Treponema sp.]